MVGVPRSQRVAIFERGGVNYISFAEILLSIKNTGSFKVENWNGVLNLYQTRYIT